MDETGVDEFPLCCGLGSVTGWSEVCDTSADFRTAFIFFNVEVSSRNYCVYKTF